MSIFFHLYRKTHGKLPLYWIDIGCNDGYTGNSTFLLESFNSNGLLIEPNHHLLGKIATCRKSPVLCCAVSDINEVAKLSVSDTVDTLSTICDGPSQSRLLQESYSEVYSIPVATVTLDQVIKYTKKLYPESQFGFLKIDAEGAEDRICGQIARLTTKPLIVEIENNYRDEALARKMSGCGYSILTVMDSFVEIWVIDNMFDFARHIVSNRFRMIIDQSTT